MQQVWIEQLKELQSTETDQKAFLENLTKDFFTDRIFVFTPQGDVIDLPAGASALDLAYAIHTEIGNTAKGAKINGKYAALKTELANGDIVEIETDKKIKPTAKWLPFVKTTLAKKHIRNHVKDSGYLSRFFGGNS
jgi:(p)ppGpp synthase/HD superfamily hydrolase